MTGTRNLLTTLLALAIACLCGVSDVRAQITFKSATSATAPTAAPSFVNSSTATLGASGASATITFRASSSDSVQGAPLSLNPPTGTLEDDIMIAVIAVTPATGGTAVGGIATPAGWTNVENQFVNEAPGTRLAVFWKRAVAGEAGPYVFAPSSGTATDMAGGILSFSGVDASNPIVSEGSSTNTTQNNVAAAPSRAAPGMNNTMLLAYFAFASSGNWPTPAGMTEAFDEASRAAGVNGVTLSGNYQAWPTNVLTGVRSSTATGSGDSEGAIGYSLLLRPAEPITISAPASMAAEDVMVASISLRGKSDTVGAQAPSGWTLVRSVTTGGAVANDTSLFVFQKVATGSEPASYTFATSGATQGVGAIAAYRGVDNGLPIDTEAGQATASSLNHATPQITTTVPNTRLVASFSASTARDWSGGAGMTQRANVKDPAGGNNAGEALSMYDSAQAAIATVGPFTASLSSSADIGATHLLALRPRCVLSIAKPGTIASGDVMVASLSVRDVTATVAAVPAGWTLLARTNNNTAGNTLSMLVYYKTYAGEAGPYQWTFDSCDYAAGGIQAFGGVDTTAGLTINASGGLANASSLTQTAPSITPTVANTMLVSAFAIRSASTWTRGSLAMTEDVDAGIPTPPATVGLSIGTYHEPWATASATGTRTATASNDTDTGIGFMLALRPTVVVVTPAGFNAYDSTTAAGATAGNIRTRVSGVIASLDVIALKAGPAIETAFTGTVRVEVLNASDNSGAFIGSTACRSSWTVIQTLVDPTFVAGDNGRKTVSFTQNNSYRDARIRVTYPAGAPTVTGCSNDDFAIRPASFAAAVTDATWSTAGTGRTLANTVATGGNVHKASQPFTITITPSPGTATLYDGSPTVSALACVLPGTCTPAMLTPGAFTGAGTRVSSTATYSEAGAFNLTLVDQTYASVDAADGTPADCSAGGLYVCQSSAPLAVGRFVPDHFVFASPSTPVLRTFNTASCAPRSFTYIGQPFWYSTLPSATLNAVTAAGTVTANYPVTSSKPAISEVYADATAPGTAPLNSSAIGSAVLTSGSGTGTYSGSVSAGAQLSYDRDPSTLVGPFTSKISLTVTANDSSENAVVGNGVISTSAALVFNGGVSGIAFDSGAEFRYGRLQIGTANGSHLLPLVVPMETQYSANGTTFTTNAADNCTTLTAANIGLGNYAGNLNSGETTPALSGAFSAGKKSLSLSAPGAGNNGSVDLVVNLGSTIDSCTTFAAPPPTPAGANLAWLRGRWCGATQSKDTTGRATFGVYLGSEEVIFTRENF